MKTKLLTLLNTYRKSGEPSKMKAFQTVLASINEREARLNVTLTEAQMLDVIKKEVKTLGESIEAFQGRDEVDNFVIQREVLSDLLPEEISLDTYEEIAKNYIVSSEATAVSDMGKVMKAIKSEYATRINMKEMSGIVRQLLNI